MKEHDAFPSTYLGKEDLESPLVAVIGDVSSRDLSTDDGGKERKPVVSFEGGIKPLIVNRCNWRTLADAFGEESDGWRGKRVEIFVDPNVTFGARKIGGLRVRIPTAPPTNGKHRTNAEILQQIKSDCAAAGVGYDKVCEAWKAAGLTGFNPDKCEPIARKLIDAAKAAKGDDGFEIKDGPPQEGDIPF